jgi:hypothetical protein
MLSEHPTDEEIQEYIFNTDHINVEILGRTEHRGMLILLVSWYRDTYLNNIQTPVSSIVDRHGEEIIGQYKNRQTTRVDRVARKYMRSLNYYVKKHDVGVQLVDLNRYPDLPDHVVSVRIYNLLIVKEGFATFRFTN